MAGSVSRAELVAGSALLDLSYAVLLLERAEQRLPQHKRALVRYEGNVCVRVWAFAVT